MLPGGTYRLVCDRCSGSVADGHRNCAECGSDYCVECCAEMRVPPRRRHPKGRASAPRELAAAKDVKSMPTILFFRDGNLVKRIVGADVTAIKSEVDKATMNPVLKLLKSETVSLADQLRASLPQT